jgi:hypothetical protein
MPYTPDKLACQHVSEQGGTLAVRPRAKQPNLFSRRHQPQPNGRTATIANFIDRRIAETGSPPSSEEIARTFAMHPDRVTRHLRILGRL